MRELTLKKVNNYYRCDSVISKYLCNIKKSFLKFIGEFLCDIKSHKNTYIQNNLIMLHMYR